MLSYIHAFHAGGLADVHKHAALAALLANLTQKPRPITYLETHAGRGLYDLASPEAVKTGEAAAGILALEKAGRLPKMYPYTKVLAEVRRRHGPNAYPGSPLLAASLLRPGDDFHLAELHPNEFTKLEQTMRGTSATLHQENGFTAMLARASETAQQGTGSSARRGLVLVDPSYEVKSDYADATEFVLALHDTWKAATILLWYPLLPAGLHRDMRARIEAAGLPRVLAREARHADPAKTRGMYGSGVLVVNAPHGVGPPLKFAQSLSNVW